MNDQPFRPEHGRAIEVAPGIRRITADNPGPFTFTGTNTYILGRGRVAVVDPGPDDPAHRAALLAALGGDTVSHVLVTHRHRDHVAGVPAFVKATGAKVAAGPARRPSFAPAGAVSDAPAEALVPDILLADGTVIDGGGWRVEAVATPGHASDHMAFAVEGLPLAFSGDHVMGWSTTVVSPPDGSMADYMASLDRLMARGETRYLPGHGGPVEDAQQRLRGLKTHRRMREAAILERLAAGDRTIPALVAAIYRDVDPRLHAAAGQSVLAHLEDLVARGRADADGPPRIDATFTARR